MADDQPVFDSVADLSRLAEAFEVHRPRLRAMLLRRIDPVLWRRVDADDLLNETFLAACRRLDGSGRVEHESYAWFYGLARDCLIEAWRRETRGRRDPRREMPWPGRSSVQLGLSLVGDLTGPSRAYARDELRQRVHAALGELKPSDREILWMRHFDDLPFREVAAVLGISEDAAMQRYSRALRRIRSLWAAGDGTEGGP